MFALAKDLINGILNRARGSKRKTSTNSSSASKEDEPLGETLNSVTDAVSEAFSSDEDILAETIDQVADDVCGFAEVTLDETVDAVDTSILNDPIPDSAEPEPKPVEPELESSSLPNQTVLPPSKSQDTTASTPTAAPASTSGSKTKDELLSRPIPPRRPKSVAQHVKAKSDATSNFQADDDDSDEIIVMSDEHIDAASVTKAAYSGTSTDQELTHLRLALEASQNDLSHLTASRNQALSLVSKYENQVEQLQRRIEESDSQSAAWHQERQSLIDHVSESQGDASRLQTELDAVSELAAVTEQKLAESASKETIQQIEAQHQSTVDELRSILGQQEAAEASLLRERDSLGEVNSQLQRKIDDLQSDLAVARESGDRAETESAQPDACDSIMAEREATDAAVEAMSRIGELEMQQQQASAELSLANETIRQLNQNLSQRDALLMNLHNEHESTKSELSAMQEAPPEQPPNNDHVEMEASRDRALADLEASEAELESNKRELDTAKQELEATHQADYATKEELAAAKESESGLQAALQSLQGKHDAAREELNAVQNNLAAELAAERNKVAELESGLQAEKQDLLDRLGASQEEINATSAEMRQLQQRLTVAEENSVIADQLKDKYHKSESVASDLMAAVQKKDAELARLQEERQLQTMNESTDEVSALQDDAVDAVRSERDEAAAAAAEASTTIAKLMVELQELKATTEEKESAIDKLKEENHEYRRSVSGLHAVANEIEELKLDRAREQQSARQRLHEATTANAELSAELASIRRQSTDNNSSLTDVGPQMAEELAAIRKKADEVQRESDAKKKEVTELQAQIDAKLNDQKEAAKAAREAKRLSTALSMSEKKLLERDARLQDLAMELSKSRAKLASLRSELTEQKAVVRALNRDDESPTSRRGAEENGRATKAVRSKKSPRRKSSPGSPAKTKAKGVPKTPKSTKTKSSSLIGQSKRDAKLGPVFTSRPSQIDDLKKISGVGPVLEKRLNAAGIYQFKQVTSWTKSIVDYLDEYLALGGRIRRDNWVVQARELSKKS